MTAREFLNWAGFDVDEDNLYALTQYIDGNVDFCQFPDAVVVTQDGIVLSECAEEPALFQEWMGRR